MSAMKLHAGSEIKVLDTSPANTAATKVGSGPAANFGMFTGGVVAPDKPPIVTTPSKPPSNFRSSYGTGGKKSYVSRKATNSSFNRGGHVGSKVVTRA